jgi:hypothetical protein
MDKGRRYTTTPDYGPEQNIHRRASRTETADCQRKPNRHREPLSKLQRNKSSDAFEKRRFQRLAHDHHPEHASESNCRRNSGGS